MPPHSQPCPTSLTYTLSSQSPQVMRSVRSTAAVVGNLRRTKVRNNRVPDKRKDITLNIFSQPLLPTRDLAIIQFRQD